MVSITRYSSNGPHARMLYLYSSPLRTRGPVGSFSNVGDKERCNTLRRQEQEPIKTGAQCVCVYVCVRERERETVCVCVMNCVCVGARAFGVIQCVCVFQYK